MVDLPDNLRKILTKFMCRNHRLPIERGCQENIPPDMRLCHYCREDIGDKYHYLLICRHFKNERKKNVESKFWKRPSTSMLKKLMNDNKSDNIQNISLFIKCILSKFKYFSLYIYHIYVNWRIELKQLSVCFVLASSLLACLSYLYERPSETNYLLLVTWKSNATSLTSVFYA